MPMLPLSFRVILAFLSHFESFKSFHLPTQWLKMTQNDTKSLNWVHSIRLKNSHTLIILSHFEAMCVIVSHFESFWVLLSQTWSNSNCLDVYQNDSTWCRNIILDWQQLCLVGIVGIVSCWLDPQLTYQLPPWWHDGNMSWDVLATLAIPWLAHDDI